MNNKYIGTIIKGDRVISKSNKKITFKVNDNIYVKDIKERNKVRQQKYVISESLNIICNDLNKNYVYVESNNKPYFNKPMLILIVLSLFIALFITGITMIFYEKFFALSLISVIALFILLICYLFYTILIQPKKIYQKYTETVEGEIINYSRTELRHDKENTFHCKYNVMYKYKTPNKEIIHSVIDNYGAEVLYKKYPIGKKVLIKYNPLKCCESCLLDEYNSLYNGEKFVTYSTFIIGTFGKITNITTRCIDNEVEEYLKPICLVDYIECEYNISGINYKTYSIFSVPHNRFKIGEEIIIFYEKENPHLFFCDINKKHSNLDTIDF